MLVVDALALRRAGIMRLLEPWAQARGLEIVSLSPEQAVQQLDVNANCKMLVFIAGGEPVARPEHLQTIAALGALVPTVPLVILADFSDPEGVGAALEVGAEGFIPGDIQPQLAIQALSFILNGGSYFPSSAMRQLRHTTGQRCERGSAGHPTSQGSAPTEPPTETTGSRTVNFTAREELVLTYMRAGEPNKLIARRLGMAEGTVKSHVRQIMRKLGATNRTQAAVALTPERATQPAQVQRPAPLPRSGGKLYLQLLSSEGAELAE